MGNKNLDREVVRKAFQRAIDGMIKNMLEAKREKEMDTFWAMEHAVQVMEDLRRELIDEDDDD